MLWGYVENMIGLEEYIKHFWELSFFWLHSEFQLSRRDTIYNQIPISVSLR